MTLFRSLLRPLLFRLPPETAHELAIHFLAAFPALAKPFSTKAEFSSGPLSRFGLTFSNPVGLAAGFDKDGVALRGLSNLGFGFIEAGTVTSQPQPGNPRPRLFRLPADKALINRAGFNNEGAIQFAQTVAKHHPNCVLGVSIGKSKAAEMENAVSDYLQCFETIFALADYVAVNVSSPNTPRLRELQQSRELEQLLSALQKRNRELSIGRPKKMPLLVKLSPDLNNEDLEQIVSVIQQSGVDGIIATNTTVGRYNLKTDSSELERIGSGGLSGAPLRKRSNELIARLYNLTNGKMPLVGVGGIFTAEDAWEKICAGASLVQVYTGLIYEGPGMVSRMVAGLEQIMAQRGFTSIDDAVGSGADEFAS